RRAPRRIRHLRGRDGLGALSPAGRDRAARRAQPERSQVRHRGVRVRGTRPSFAWTAPCAPHAGPMMAASSPTPVATATGVPNTIVVDGVRKTFGAGTPNEVRALQGVSLAIAEGSFVVVIGTNGSGKSTLLNALA